MSRIPPDPGPFPLAALGPMLANVVAQIHRETAAPIPSIVSAVLVAISLVCQGRTRIRKRPGLVSPTSLWFVVVLDSGERKSAVLKAALRAIEEFIQEQAEVYDQKLERYRADLSAWEAEAKGMLASIRKKSRNGEPTERVRKRLTDHNALRPRKPRRFKLIHEKMTPLALIRNLAECYPTTGLISDETACVFSSRALSDLGVLNKAHDGSPITVETSEQSLFVSDPALTLALYVQPQVAERYIQDKGDLARGVGFLARGYWVTPPAAAGSRFLAYSMPPSPECVAPFHARCKEILESHLDETSETLPQKIELHFSLDAQRRWEQEHDIIESHMNPGGFFCSDKDFASKHADRIARLAALLHYFRGEEGPIPLETLEQSIVVSAWFATEFVRNFSGGQQVTQAERDANSLLIWLANHLRRNGQLLIKKNDVRQYGPNQLRDKSRLNAALLYLWENRIAWDAKNPADKTTYVVLNQEYFTAHQVEFLCAQPPIAS